MLLVWVVQWEGEMGDDVRRSSYYHVVPSLNVRSTIKIFIFIFIFFVLLGIFLSVCFFGSVPNLDLDLAWLGRPGQHKKIQ